MENINRIFRRKLRQIICAALIVMMLPIIPVHSVHAEGCAHTNILPASTRPIRLEKPDYQQYNETIHKGFYRFWAYYCVDCGVGIHIPDGTFDEAHSFSQDGVCTKCGYKREIPSCDHTTSRDKISTKIEKYSDTSHRMVITYRVHCACGQVDYQDEVESFPEHQFDGNGLCECGYQRISNDPDPDLPDDGECEHEVHGPATFRNREYYRLDRNAEGYEKLHQYVDRYTYTCAKCGQEVSKYNNYGYENHSSQVPCVCGYVPDECNLIHSASFSPVDLCEPGHNFTVTVVCDETVSAISAVNDANTRMNNVWQKTASGNGTVTFSRTYTAGEREAPGRYWTVTAYSKTNRAVGTARTNSLDIRFPDHEHQFTAKTVISEEYQPDPNDARYHYLVSYEEQLSCIQCGALGETIKHTVASESAILSSVRFKHDFVAGKCEKCGYLTSEGVYYTDLIQMIRNGENPMENDIFVSVLRNYLVEEGSFTQSQAQEMADVLKEAPETYRNIYLLGLYNYKIEGLSNECLYLGETNTLYMDRALNPAYFEHTVFHESGHAVQISLYCGNPVNRSNTEDFAPLEYDIRDALRNDVKNKISDRLDSLSGNSLTTEQKTQIVDALVNGDDEVPARLNLFGQVQEEAHESVKDDEVLKKYYIMVRDQLRDEADLIPYSNASMVSDLYGGFTNNKINGRVGHDEEYYWYYEDGREKILLWAEAWAEFYSAKIRNDTTNMELNRAYFPTAIPLLESLADDILATYWDYYSGIY